MMGNYFKKQKPMFILLGVNILSFFLLFIGLLLVTVSKQEEVNQYLLTAKLTGGVISIFVLGGILVLLFLVFLFLISVLFIKLLIPNRKIFSSLMMKDEIDFLLRLPNELKEEVDKNGQ